mmetsp:Transcript_83839/g.153037  ORF Transcript_83839/g.153037 Transcript_83839/m.153037 type:complete len:178 (-) Transcript_83839:54-587(-)
MTGVIIPGGHSGSGLVQLQEMAQGGYYDFYEAVSKRGRPDDLGSASAIYEALMQKNVIYHAKCDIHDPMAYNDLLEYTPPYSSVFAEESPPMMAYVSDMRASMGDMDLATAKSNLSMVEASAADYAKQVKEMKRRVGNPSYKDSQDEIEASVSSLEEQETQLMELAADLAKKINESS